MIIDAHNHPEWYGYTLERFLANMDQYGIDRTWLLSWEAPEDEYDPVYKPLIPDPGPDGPIAFRHCLDFYDRAPDRFVLGFAPDPRRPDALARLDEAVREHHVRVYGELKLRMMLDNPDAIRVFRYCGAHGLPVILHIDYELPAGPDSPRPNWWYSGGIEALARTLALCPETVFLGHAPGFWAHISGDELYRTESYPAGPVLPGGRLLELLDSCPNLYCDISAGSGFNALSRDLAFTRNFILAYQDRILFGRDYFDNRHQDLIGQIDLPDDVRAKLLGGNACKLVPLS